jgi:hypothetical protein
MAVVVLLGKVNPNIDSTFKRVFSAVLCGLLEATTAFS